MPSFPIYIIRHGLAGQFGDYSDDAQRPLTNPGRLKTTQVAQRLKTLDVQLDHILTSPYQRAAQTAAILHQQYPQAQLETLPALQPGGNFTQLLDRLQHHDRRQSIAIVGHEPDLSHTAERLIWGEIRSRLILKKTGIIRLEAPITGDLLGHCELRWLIPAKVLLA
ncbi:phosphohistidine phosphatase SixA [filamentous cyanobacterium LEGE 11480]|uniref:Phosphohistidine phosphatase SixA n=1 Tax=Romeriopsis navalis LEGE 11480 TaxID=2777977 RepID=A0A928Z2S6_9CYAN|nr:phosphohistidine phosphatase SixA [Romeriopsis navalis]MBE9028670.1 phosphohistidine phosphatase SixA [Romeriopsis navalis LEGE 11480]